MLLIACLILPIIATIMVVNARKQIRALQSLSEDQEEKLSYLYAQLRDLKADRPQQAVQPPHAKIPDPVTAKMPPTPPITLDDGPTQESKPASSAPSAPSTPSADLQPVLHPDGAPEQAPLHQGAAASSIELPGDTEAPPLPPKTATARVPEAENIVEPAPEPTVPPQSFEQKIAGLFTRVGAGALLLGVLYFFKYAVDNEWIGPTGRVLVGVVAGLGILIAAEVIRPKTKPAYVHALAGVGLACLYIAAYASSAYYKLIPTELAFAVNGIILLLGAALANRYRGQPILVLVLIAGFLNPVLLSTGHDNPAGLFSYMLLLTSVALFVASRHGFRLPIVLSIVGVLMISAGWYERFFEVFDRRDRGLDRAPEELVGAYFALASRWAPLAAVAAFSAQWLGLAAYLKQRERLTAWVLPIVLSALILAHLGYSALLYDKPIALGLVVLLLAVLSIGALHRLEALRFLLAPMLCASMVLGGLSGKLEQNDRLILLIILGVWTALYVAAFLKDLLRRAESFQKADAVRAAVALGLFEVLAGIYLYPGERYLIAMGALILASAALCWLAHRAQLWALNFAGLLLSLLMALPAAVMSARSDALWDPLFLLTAVLMVAPFAASAFLAKSRERGWLITLSICGLGYLGLALLSVDKAAPTLRALLTAGVGIASLGAATFLRGKEQKDSLDNEWSTIMAAQALGLFVPAVALGMSGATVTVLWSVFTLICALLLARSRSNVWLIMLAALVTITLFRLFAVDVQEAQSSLRAFVWSQGRKGQLSLPVFFNARAYALLGVGLSFWGGAVLLGRALKAQAEAKRLLPVPAVLFVIAYGLLCTLAVLEVRAALLELPTPPEVALDNEEFTMFMRLVAEAKMAQVSLLAVSTTVVLASFAMLLLGIGFVAKDILHRYLGLLLFVLTIGKLVGWDVWNLARIYQVIALTVVGVLLLSSGFLYARLKNLFKPSAITGVLLLALLPASARAEHPIDRYRWTAPIPGVSGEGYQRLIVPPQLYPKSEAKRLFDDLRLLSPQGKEVPYVLRTVAPAKPSRWFPGEIYDPGEVGNGAFRATFKLPEGIEHCEVKLELKSSSPYMRRTQIETGTTLTDMQLISEGSMVYSLNTEGVRYSRARLKYPRSLAPFLRVTLLPDPDADVTQIRGAKFACRTPKTITPKHTVPLKIVGQKKVDKRTEIILDAGQHGAPIQTLHLEIQTPEFVRRVRVGASSYKKVWPRIGSSVLDRVAGAATSEAHEIPLSRTQKRWLQVRIFDEDNAPLKIARAWGSFEKEELIFKAQEAGKHALYLGYPDARAPRYDLASILKRRQEPLAPLDVSMGPVVANPAFGVPQTTKALPWTEKHRKTIGLAMVVVLLALSIWAVRLLRN